MLISSFRKSLIHAANITGNVYNLANKRLEKIIKHANLNIKLNTIIKTQPYIFFLPRNTKFDIDLELTKKNGHINPITYKNLPYEFLRTKGDNKIYYTDATESENGVGIAIIHKNLLIRYKLPEMYLAKTTTILN